MQLQLFLNADYLQEIYASPKHEITFGMFIKKKFI